MLLQGQQGCCRPRQELLQLLLRSRLGQLPAHADDETVTSRRWHQARQSQQYVMMDVGNDGSRQRSEGSHHNNNANINNMCRQLHDSHADITTTTSRERQLGLELSVYEYK